MLTEPVECSTCGAVSVNGGTLHCHGCYSLITRELAEAKDAIAHLSKELECAERRVQSVALASGFTSHNYDGLVSHIARLRETVEKLPTRISDPTYPELCRDECQIAMNSYDGSPWMRGLLEELRDYYAAQAARSNP